MKLHSNITIYFAVWLASILFIMYFGFLAYPNSSNFSNDFFKSLSNWDGGHFLSIAQFGYGEKFQFAFFPLYPLVIKLVSQLTQNYLIAAISVNLISVFFAFQLLYKLMLRDFNKYISERVVLGLMIFPTSFYFLTAYTESLFFLFIVATFYFLRQKKLLLATFFAILASATRLVGLAVVFALILDVILKHGFRKKLWYIFLAPLGFLLYCAYLFTHLRDPFYFLTAELHWQRSLSIPVISFWETIRNLSQTGFIKSNFDSLLDLIFAIIGVGFAFRSFRFLSPGLSIYIFISVLIPLFTPTLSSMPRFLLPIFPIFILLALNKNKYLNFGYYIVSILLLSIFSTLFINGYWVS